MARYCTNCYTPATDDDVLCKNCGQPLKAAKMSDTPVAVEEKCPVVTEISEKEEQKKQEPGVKQKETVKDGKITAEVISFGEWVWSLLLCFVPLVNLIMLIIWSTTSETNPNKQNFARAMLIWTVVGIVFSIVFLSMAMVLAMMGYAGGFRYGIIF